MSEFDISGYIKNPTNAFIDKITLELLLNKTSYQKYLSKTDPQKHSERQEFLYKVDKYQDSILSITADLISDTKKQYTIEVSEAFDTYAQTLIKYLEITSSQGTVRFPEPLP
jgi:hypothetical protein